MERIEKLDINDFKDKLPVELILEAKINEVISFINHDLNRELIRLVFGVEGGKRNLKDIYLSSLRTTGVKFETPRGWLDEHTEVKSPYKEYYYELHDLLKPYHQEGEDYADTLKRLLSKLKYKEE